MYRTEKWILFVITLLAILASANFMIFAGSKAAAEIFDSSWKTLPPLATLVIGYVFGHSNR